MSSVRRISSPLLLNNNLFVRRNKNCVVRNDCMGDHKRMRYFVEPVHVPLRMLPNLVLRDRVTLLLLAKDRDSKLHEGHNHLIWCKLRNRRRRSRNGMDIAVLPQNPLRQVTHHPVFAGHDPSSLPSYVMKRRHVSSSLVRPSDDISMLHRISCGTVVSSVTP